MSLLTSLAAALAGGLIFERLNVPAGSLVGAAVAVGALNLAGHDSSTLPSVLEFGAYICVGWLIGDSVTPELIGEIRRLAVPILGTVLTLLAVGGLLAVVLSRFWQVDPATAFLAAAPGGLSQVAALGTAVDALVGVVVAVHVLRVVSVLLLSPIVVRILVR